MAYNDRLLDIIVFSFPRTHSTTRGFRITKSEIAAWMVRRCFMVAGLTVIFGTFLATKFQQVCPATGNWVHKTSSSTTKWWNEIANFSHNKAEVSHHRTGTYNYQFMRFFSQDYKSEIESEIRQVHLEQHLFMYR